MVIFRQEIHSANRNKLLQKLSDIGIPINFLLLLHYYKSTTVGVTQGANLSPPLFSLLIHDQKVETPWTSIIWYAEIHSANRNKLLQKLSYIGIPINFLLLLHYYKSTTVGVTQGANLSPPLFSLLIHDQRVESP